MKRLKKRIEEVNDKANRTAFYRNSLQDLLLVLKSKHVLMIIAFILLLSCTRAVDAECPAGFSCENGAVTPCEPGWYSLKGEVSCKRCRPGTYCEKTTEPPMDCKDGEYSQWSFTKCELCPAGYVCKLYNGETQFMRCPMGQFTKVGGTECLPTPPGYMSASPAQEPMACFDGYFTTTMNSTYCNLCPRGYQCKEKDKEPSICPEGTYSGQGSTECTKCPENMFCPEGSSYPRECPIDNPNCWVDKVPNEIETVTDTGKRNLQTCTGGNYWDGYNCQTCPEGYTCAAGTNITPSRCGTDTYSAAGATSCTSCGSNYICPTPRSSDRYQCQAGFVKSGTLYCRPCAEGKYCPDGANEYSCNPAAGTRQYSPGGLSACLSCPASTECTQYSYIDCTEGFYYECKLIKIKNN